MTSISLEDLAAHNQRDDAWVAIRGQVYDITAFVGKHPGGAALDPVLGTVCTTRFVAAHLSNVEARLAKPEWRERMGIELLGTIEIPETLRAGGRYGQSVQWSDAPEPFLADLTRRVQQILRQRGESQVGGYSGVLTLAVVLPLHVAAWYTAMVMGQWWACILLGYFTALIGMKIGHPSVHGGFSSNPAVNSFARHCFDLFNGVSWRLWDEEHTNHHDNTNTAHDTDLRHQPILRMHPEQPTLPHQRFQHLYVLPMYALVAVRWWFSSSVDALRSDITPFQKLTHLVFKVPTAFAYFVAPAIFLDPLQAVLFVALFWVSVSYALTLNFALTHTNTMVEYPSERPADLPWAEVQVRTSSNWRSGSTLWNHISGGMNHQIEHHLFPVMNHRLYPIIASTVEQTCRDHGIPYNDAPSFRSLIASHLGELRRLGAGVEHTA